MNNRWGIWASAIALLILAGLVYGLYTNRDTYAGTYYEVEAGAIPGASAGVIYNDGTNWWFDERGNGRRDLIIRPEFRPGSGMRGIPHAPTEHDHAAFENLKTSLPARTLN